MIYRGSASSGRLWRLAGIADVVQLTMVGFVGGFLWRIPRLVALTLATVL
jgi:hypothetical protein